VQVCRRSRGALSRHAGGYTIVLPVAVVKGLLHELLVRSLIEIEWSTCVAHPTQSRRRSPRRVHAENAEPRSARRRATTPPPVGPAAVRPARRSSGNTDTQAVSAHCAVCVSVLPPDRCRAPRAHRRERRVISLRVTPPLRVLCATSSPRAPPSLRAMTR